MLSAKKMAEALEQAGVKVVGFEESQNPQLMDGEVSLADSLSVQVGADYACFCRIEADDINYLFEVEELNSEADFADQLLKFLQSAEFKKP
jgi:hypothetical protein